MSNPLVWFFQENYNRTADESLNSGRTGPSDLPLNSLDHLTYEFLSNVELGTHESDRLMKRTDVKWHTIHETQRGAMLLAEGLQSLLRIGILAPCRVCVATRTKHVPTGIQRFICLPSDKF